MRAKSERRLEAERLRREQGLSYKEIEALTGTNRSTLSGWLKDIPLRREQEARLQDRLRENRSSFAARALPINRARHERARQVAYESGMVVARGIRNAPDIHELALAMLYLGEGSKAGNSVILSNTNPAIVRYFVSSLRRLYELDEARLNFRLHLVERARAREASLIAWWSAELQCGVEQFQKTGYDRRLRAGEVTDDYRGVCAVVYHDTALHQRLMGLVNGYLEQQLRSWEK